jgi:hypothetical protein
VKLLILALCWLCIGTGILSAQIDRGTIEGQVTDSSGAIIPGAKVQVTNVNTNTSIALETNERGLYTASNLPTGTYRVGFFDHSPCGYQTSTRPSHGICHRHRRGADS